MTTSLLSIFFHFITWNLICAYLQMSGKKQGADSIRSL